MCKSLRSLTALFVISVMAASATHGESEEITPAGGTTVNEKPVQFIIQLHGTRDGWPSGMTPDEERIMGEHFIYLQNLMHEGKVLLAGPCLDPVYGLIVLEVADEAEARKLMDNEPSVVGGLHTYTLHPFIASLLIRRDLLPAKETDRRIRKEVVVNASRDSVWNAWTTAEGVASFSAPEANIELKAGGRYEWLFLPPTEPKGFRGGEGCRILSFLPKEMLSFTWNAPPQFEAARRARTRVVILFADAGPNQTKVTLTHLGWGEDEMWNPVYDYFDAAWGRVLANLEKRFQNGE